MLIPPRRGLPQLNWTHTMLVVGLHACGLLGLWFWPRRMDRGVSFTLPWLLTAGLCYAIAGWRGVLWGAVLRTLALWHLTWCINSVCHVWGRRPNATRDESRNVWWLGLLTLGEGWHNNHHAHPASALHGWRWYEVDCSGYVIRLLTRIGLVWQVVRAP